VRKNKEEPTGSSPAKGERKNIDDGVDDDPPVFDDPTPYLLPTGSRGWVTSRHGTDAMIDDPFQRLAESLTENRRLPWVSTCEQVMNEIGFDIDPGSRAVHLASQGAIFNFARNRAIDDAKSLERIVASPDATDTAELVGWFIVVMAAHVRRKMVAAEMTKGAATLDRVRVVVRRVVDRTEDPARWRFPLPDDTDPDLVLGCLAAEVLRLQERRRRPRRASDETAGGA
jgi:hypothetical protein